MKSLKGMTPFEAGHGRKPDVSFLRTFGCVGHVKATKPHLSKLEDRSMPMVLLVYKVSSKAHRLFDPCGSKVVSLDVVFDEKVAWDQGSLGTGGPSGVHGIRTLTNRATSISDSEIGN